MVLAGIKAIYPSKKTPIRKLTHIIFPYLLQGLIIEHPHQVLHVHITSIKMRRSFLYVVCLIDIFSRKIMGWMQSLFLDTKSGLETLNRALQQSTTQIINAIKLLSLQVHNGLML